MQKLRQYADECRNLILEKYPSTLHQTALGFAVETTFANHVWLRTHFDFESTGIDEADTLQIRMDGRVLAAFKPSIALYEYLLIDLPQKINEQVFCTRSESDASVFICVYAAWQVVQADMTAHEPSVFLGLFESVASSLGVMQEDLFSKF